MALFQLTRIEIRVELPDDVGYFQCVNREMMANIQSADRQGGHRCQRHTPRDGFNQRHQTPNRKPINDDTLRLRLCESSTKLNKHSSLRMLRNTRPGLTKVGVTAVSFVIDDVSIYEQDGGKVGTHTWTSIASAAVSTAGESAALDLLPLSHPLLGAHRVSSSPGQAR